MKNEIRKGAESRLRTLAIGSLFLTFLCLPIGASAALGGDVSSVVADQQQMKAMRAVQAKPNYTVHEITTPYGTTVRNVYTGIWGVTPPGTPVSGSSVPAGPFWAY